MAKNKPPPPKPGKKSKKVSPSKTIAIKRPVDALDAYGAMHARLLNDPCGADLCETVYGGDRGYINRFVTNTVLGTGATDTSFVIAIKFGQSSAYYASGAGNFGASAVFGNGVPGAAYLAANSNKVRCAAGCVTIRPNSAPNTSTGSIYYGIVPCSAFPSGANRTVGALAELVSGASIHAAAAIMEPFEVKWSPGGFDTRYAPLFSTADDDSDRNMLLVVGVGLPAGTGITLRTTAVWEWSPIPGGGVAIDATQTTPSSCDIQCASGLRIKRAEA
jgi:hypothetical protein